MDHNMDVYNFWEEMTPILNQMIAIMKAEGPVTVEMKEKYPELFKKLEEKGLVTVDPGVIIPILDKPDH